jgi:hypothetical protein
MPVSPPVAKLGSSFAMMVNLSPASSLADSVAMTGDNLWTPIRWKHQRNLSALRGQKLQLHVRLDRAKLFGYRVVAVGQATESATR